MFKNRTPTWFNTWNFKAMTAPSHITHGLLFFSARAPSSTAIKFDYYCSEQLSKEHRLVRVLCEYLPLIHQHISGSDNVTIVIIM